MDKTINRMKKEEHVPTGSIPVYCSKCFSRKGFDIYEAVTDVGKPIERYYAVCRKCGHVLPLKPKGFTPRILVRKTELGVREISRCGEDFVYGAGSGSY